MEDCISQAAGLHGWCSPHALPGLPDFRIFGILRSMETVKVGKKGQVTIPRRILDAVGIPAESTVIVEPEADGSIRLRPTAVYPIERYSDERIEEFEQENRLPPALERRVRQALNRDRT
jgi:AbrB family looped-hinge helix DNA binding protein